MEELEKIKKLPEAEQYTALKDIHMPDEEWSKSRTESSKKWKGMTSEQKRLYSTYQEFASKSYAKEKISYLEKEIQSMSSNSILRNLVQMANDYNIKIGKRMKIDGSLWRFCLAASAFGIYAFSDHPEKFLPQIMLDYLHTEEDRKKAEIHIERENAWAVKTDRARALLQTGGTEKQMSILYLPPNIGLLIEKLNVMNDRVGFSEFKKSWYTLKYILIQADILYTCAKN